MHAFFARNIEALDIFREQLVRYRKRGICITSCWAFSQAAAQNRLLHQKINDAAPVITGFGKPTVAGRPPHSEGKIDHCLRAAHELVFRSEPQPRLRGGLQIGIGGLRIIDANTPVMPPDLFVDRETLTSRRLQPLSRRSSFPEPADRTSCTRSAARFVPDLRRQPRTADRTSPSETRLLQILIGDGDLRVLILCLDASTAEPVPRLCTYFYPLLLTHTASVAVTLPSVANEGHPQGIAPCSLSTCLLRVVPLEANHCRLGKRAASDGVQIAAVAAEVGSHRPGQAGYWR